MVFTILIGSQFLNLVVISFGGEHYIQSFLRSFDTWNDLRPETVRSRAGGFAQVLMASAALVLLIAWS